jgi:ligand-binding sensor protein
VYDVEGVRITDFKKWANQLCPALRETAKGQKFICAVAHQNIAAQTIRTRKTVVEECDAGLMKLAVPIFMGNEFLGVAGGCGLLWNKGEVDAYLVHRITDLDQTVVESLTQDIETIPDDRLEAVISYLEKKVTAIIREAEISSAEPELNKASVSYPLREQTDDYQCCQRQRRNWKNDGGDQRGAVRGCQRPVVGLRR